ncbi:hypothetical protein [Paenibacillus hexagrammi]|uniref:Uncharacterized protein n=1 Tax=Paenibacillus hexagrammi TaxID=2908839 RepID=A0ABY3SL50_9BACL|nr:hypothetical protein [Paenibacillus sp. YPD9-1]UJF34691.1 hypothetical protein L0M14_05830 [Paenibacillus sp. YPD9-1]
MNIILYEKKASGELEKLSERPWDEKFMQALDAANYLLAGGKEYEMIEGRLNLDGNVFELLLTGVGGQEEGGLQ